METNKLMENSDKSSKDVSEEEDSSNQEQEVVIDMPIS
jgi:hypothetical protein